jgi:hypothetical protein
MAQYRGRRDAVTRERDLIHDFSQEGRTIFSLLTVLIIVAAAFALFYMYAGSTPSRNSVVFPPSGPGQSTPTNP